MTFSLAATKAIVVLDSEGKRIFSKYYSLDLQKEETSLEKNLFEKTKKNPTGEICMLDGLVVVYKNSVDVFIYLVGSPDENEILLYSALHSFYEALNMVFKAQVEKRLIVENFDIAFLTLDETFEEGILLESDPTQIAARVTKIRPEDDSIGMRGSQLAEQTLSQALAMAKEQITKSLLK